MDTETLLKDFINKEELCGCYTCKVAGDYVYNIIRSRVRRLYLEINGQKLMQYVTPLQKKKAICSFIISFWQLLKLGLKRKHVENLIFPFHRTEKVGKFYVDKFTDPVIEFSQIKESCLIFERSRGGVHRTPRMHKKMIIYTDFFDVFARIYAMCFSSFFEKKYKKELDPFWESLNQLLPYSEKDRKLFVRKINEFRALSFFYRHIYRKLSPKRIFVTPRIAFFPQLSEAKKVGLMTIEFQHGITYGETSTYSGQRDFLFTPDCFFSFGNMSPRNVYGIDENRIINIGWAFPLLVKELNDLPSLSEKDILVISDPEITDNIIDVVIKLAEDNPSYKFHIRPHPMERLEKKHVDGISNRDNIVIQDNKINSNVVLNSFTHIIGENSTVLYEALSMGKKVGKLCYPVFHPIYLNLEDKGAVWEIASQQDFLEFISENITIRRSLSIYSTFDATVLSKIGL
ncbi:hypothetical protein [Butyricimonas sp.]|uniref:hypothetical protein n=1 Tax=Butyricimonas sp. TaxID=1969738 RepID=UPI0025BE7E59|nr:hypothetical protein [Butyricimonas sp.]